jgi:hypothetical protein
VKVSVQLIVHPDDDAAAAPMVREVFSLDRDGLTPDTLGLQLAEAQDLLVAVQDTLITHQVRDAVAAQVPCPHCGRPRRHKDTRAIVVRSLFGALRLPSPPLVALPLPRPAHPNLPTAGRRVARTDHP